MRRMLRAFGRKKDSFLRRVLKIEIIVIVLYCLFIGVLIYVLTDLIPKLSSELSEIPEQLPFFQDEAVQVRDSLEHFKDAQGDMVGSISTAIQNVDSDLLGNIIQAVTDTGFFVIQIFGSLVLSFVMIADRKKLLTYLKTIQAGHFAFIYHEWSIIFEKITK